MSYRPLYSLLVRDGCGSWIPCAYFFTKSLEAGVIVECLQQIRQWCEGEGGWNLQYLLTDDSSAEQKGFHEGVHGMQPPVQCLLCTVHSQRTLRKNLGKSPALKHMVDALCVRRSKAECMESIQSALEVANERDKAYIERNWKSCTSLWAHYVRDPVPLLLQVCDFSQFSLYARLCNP
jgi:MULE transposase domain